MVCIKYYICFFKNLLCFGCCNWSAALLQSDQLDLVRKGFSNVKFASYNDFISNIKDYANMNYCIDELEEFVSVCEKYGIDYKNGGNVFSSTTKFGSTTDAISP